PTPPRPWSTSSTSPTSCWCAIPVTGAHAAASVRAATIGNARVARSGGRSSRSSTTRWSDRMTGWLILHAAIAAMATWAARRYAIGRDLLDLPGGRRGHAVATPRGGGIALVLALLVAACALAFREPQHRVLLAAFVVGITMVAVAGLVDDHRPLSPWLRLLVHALAGLVFGAAMQLTFDLPCLSVVAVLAVLVLTNIGNIIDRVNGVEVAQALVGGAPLHGGGGA